MKEFDTYNDTELWAEITASNKLAFDNLVNRYWKTLFESALKSVRSMDTAQDLVQDVFLHIWIKRESLAIEHIEAYLKTSIRFRVYSYFSRNKITDEFSELFNHITDPSNSASNTAYYSDLKKLVRAWINTLPAKRRTIFILYLEDQLSTREIAEKLQISQKTVQNQLNRSIGNLRTKISDYHIILILLTGI